MFNCTTYANSRPDGLGVLEVEGPAPVRKFVPLQRTTIAGSVFGPLAALRVTHHFRFSRHAFPQPIEARYRFPLPGDAAVLGVSVRFGDVEITATLDERQAAEASYQQALAEGRQAALVTREAPDVFTLAVAGIPPETDVRVETAYVQLARPEGAGWSLRVPLTTAPRYVREDEQAGRHAQGQPLAALRDPGHRASLALAFHGAAGIQGSLPLVVEGGVARLAAGEVLPDRDLVLGWRPEQAGTAAALRAIAHADADGRTYFLACAAPPARPADPRLAREVVLLVDNSGSMGGAKWQAALWAVRSFLGSLQAEDHVALAFFENRPHWSAERPLPATPENLARLEAFLGQYGPSGGTELGLALGEAYALPHARGMATRHLLVITDAEVPDGGRIIRSIEDAAAARDFRRTSLICIDAAPNALLVQEMAEAGRGTAHFLTSSPAEEDVATTLDALLEAWARPSHANLAVEAPAGVEAPGRAIMGSAIDAGDLPAGRAAWVHGRVAGSGPLALRLMADAPVAPGIGPDDGLAPTVSPGRVELGACEATLVTGELGAALKALFGARKLLGLEHLAHAHHGQDVEAVAAGLRKLGYDQAAIARALGPAPIYPEQRARYVANALRQFLVAESLAYGIPCAETAFVATRREAGRPVACTVAVANALPAGMDTRFEVRAALPAGRPRAMAPVAQAPAFDAAMAPAPATLKRSQRGKREVAKDAPLYSGTPGFAAGEAVLFDGPQPDGVIRGLEVALQGGFPAGLDPELAIVIFIDDPSAPRARVKLADLARQGGRRPLNLAVAAGQQVRVLLVDPNGAWASGAPQLTITLAR